MLVHQDKISLSVIILRRVIYADIYLINCSVIFIIFVIYKIVYKLPNNCSCY